MALLVFFALIVLACLSGVPALSYHLLARMDSLTGANLQSERPFVMWACWGLVFGAATALWLDAPLYGRRQRRWVVLVVPSVLLIASSVFVNIQFPAAAWPADPEAPPPPPPPAPNFAGTWDTGKWGAVTFEQYGTQVFGRYAQPGVLEGAANSPAAPARLTFRWRNEGSSANGVGYFDLAADAQTFTGKWTESDELRENGGQDWNGTRTGNPPPPLNFTGDWDTEWGEMHLKAGVSTVTGTYQYGGGTIQGNLAGDTLRFRWFNRITGQTGTGRLVLAVYAKKFSGTWNTGTDPDADGEPWNGIRKGTATE